MLLLAGYEISMPNDFNCIVLPCSRQAKDGE
jgi:hypothetical protein